MAVEGVQQVEDPVSLSAHRYRADIDGLRALAIVLVVAFHVGVPGFRGGFVGVDVFFVISGYLITGLLWRELQTTGRISWWDFYARRVRRLLPALALVTLGTLLLGMLLMVPDPELRWLAQSVLAVTAFVSNMFFYLKTSGYFGADAESLPLLNTWSLAVEEQFYIVWPIVLSAAWWVVRRHRVRGRLAVAIGISAVGVGSFVMAVALVRADQAAAFYWMPPRLWELAAGGLLALGAVRLPNFSRATAVGLMLAGIALIGGSSTFLSNESSFPGFGALPVVAGTVIIIAAGSVTGSNPVSRILAVRPLVMIGKVSYSWYLIHWPLLTFARITSMESRLPRDAAIAVGSLGLAWLSYRFVEQPFRHSNRARTTSLRTLVVGGCVIGVLAATGALVLRDTERASVLEISASEAAALRENRTARDACPNLPTGVSSAVDCEFNPGRDKTLVLAGDSHALAILPAAKAAAERLGWSLQVLWDTGCPFIVGFDPPAGTRQLGDDCVAENINNAEHIAANADVIGAVLITSRASSWVIQGDPTVTQAAAEAYESALAQTLRVGTERGVPVLLMLDVPRFDRAVPQCVIRLGADSCSKGAGDAASFRAPVSDAELAAIRAAPGAVGWDPFEVLCDNLCFATAGADVLYRDADHLSEAGAAFLSPDLVAQVSSMVGGTPP